MTDRTVIIKIQNEIKVTVMNLPKAAQDYFYDKYAFRPPDYRFHPDFKRKKWDGHIRLFDKMGNTFFNFLPEIIADIKGFGFKIKLKDQRKFYDINVPLVDPKIFAEYEKNGDPIVLGDHQVNAINALTQSNGGIIIAGTGAGKTFICAALAKLYHDTSGLKTVIVVPNSGLVMQTAKELNSVGIDCGRMNADYKEFDRTHLVTTWQTLINQKKVLSLFDVVIIDECQGAKAKELRAIIEHECRDKPVIIGMTGTLPKEESHLMTIHALLGEIKYTVPAAELVEKGWLASFDIVSYILIENFREQYENFLNAHPELEDKTSYAEFKRTYFPDYTSEKSHLERKKSRIQMIATMIDHRRGMSENGNTFVLVRSIKFGKALAAEIPGAIFVYGADKQAIRSKIFDLFKEGDDVTVVSTFKLASTGLDIPRIFKFWMIDPPKSYVEVIQSIGRSLRKAADKTSAEVFDVSSDLKFSSRHRNARLRFYKEERYPYSQKKLDYSKIMMEEDVD